VKHQYSQNNEILELGSFSWSYSSDRFPAAEPGLWLWGTPGWDSPKEVWACIVHVCELLAVACHYSQWRLQDASLGL